MLPGQKIEVRSPDGRRTVDTVVPDGVKTGQTFLVRFPPSPEEPATLQSMTTKDNEDVTAGTKPAETPRSFAQALEDLLLPTPDPDVQQRITQLQSSPAKKQDEPIALTMSQGKAQCKPEASPANVETREDQVLSLESDDDEEVEEEELEDSAQDSDSGMHPSDPEPSKRDPTPKAERQDRLSLVRSLEDFLTPVPDPQPSKPDSPKTLPPPTTRSSRFSPRSGARKPFSREVRESHMMPTQHHYQYQNRYNMQSTSQKLLQVQVPPGLPPGATIFVEIPGENRTVAAQVPPNVTSFHVAYTPQLYGMSIPPPTQARAVVVPRPQAGREKLLSVRVPPGTPPGTTLHVSVPDEPGRILAAQVPPGNVSKFHVSYVPSEHVAPRGMLPPASPYKSAPHPTGHPYSRDPPHDAYGQSSFGGGAAVLGAVGASAYNHFANSASDLREYAYSGGGEDGAATGESWEGYDF